MKPIHNLTKLVKQVNKTHRRLGPLIAANLLAAKAQKCILNISPAGCGKSTATDTVYLWLGDHAKKYFSINISALQQIMNEISNFNGHIVIDDLGAEKSTWSRIASITLFATLVYTHNIDKPTRGPRIIIENFEAGVSLNILPVLMNYLVASEDWIAVVRDKVLRYYHLIRPLKPRAYLPTPETGVSNLVQRFNVTTITVAFQTERLPQPAGHRLGRTAQPRQTTQIKG